MGVNLASPDQQGYFDYFLLISTPILQGIFKPSQADAVNCRFLLERFYCTVKVQTKWKFL